MMLSASHIESTKSNPTRMTGPFKDYFLGLDALRNDLSKKGEDLKSMLKEFYKVSGTDNNDENYRTYLLSVSAGLDVCNNLVTAGKDRRPIIIDGQVPIARLINRLKESSIYPNAGTLEMIIDFWENIKYVLELAQILIDSFEKDIYSKLSVMYSCCPMMNEITAIGSSDDQVQIFMTDISKFSKLLPEKIMKCRLLIKSCGTHLRVSLLDRSMNCDKILAGVASEKYPLLKVIPDIDAKINDILRISRMWLDREETFILNINKQIRERKILAKEKETRIISAKDHQKDVIKSLKTAYILCQNSKIKMKNILKELKTLEGQIKAATIDQQRIGEEKYKTESMAEFLSISISQTRKNYSLQMKKQRLEAQVEELETTLIQLDAEISMLKQEMIFKSEEKLKTRNKLEMEEKSYLDAKKDLDSYSQSLKNYKTELISIRESLNTMEGFKLLKSSPEYIENVFGDDERMRKHSVHLAPSLLDAINKRTLRTNFIM